MTVKKSVATKKMVANLHAFALLEYNCSRNLRKAKSVYDFENSFLSKYKAYKDFELLENEINKDISKIKKTKRKIMLI